jgi:hypothetical protein
VQGRIAPAQVRLDAVQRAGPTATLMAARDLAGRQAAAAADDLAQLSSRFGVQVPADELLFFPALPLRVDDVKATRGGPATGELMTVSGLQLAVDSSLSAGDAALVRKGVPAKIEEPDLRLSASGSVSVVADRPGTNGVDAQRFYLEVIPSDAPAQLVGASVKITIPVKSTGGDVLAVPLSALSLGADGSSRVQVLRATGPPRFVAVTPGLVAQGLVEITPRDGPLGPGDRVVVGAANPPTGGTARGAPGG